MSEIVVRIRVSFATAFLTDFLFIPIYLNFSLFMPIHLYLTLFSSFLSLFSNISVNNFILLIKV